MTSIWECSKRKHHLECISALNSVDTQIYLPKIRMNGLPLWSWHSRSVPLCSSIIVIHIISSPFHKILRGTLPAKLSIGLGQIPESIQTSRWHNLLEFDELKTGTQVVPLAAWKSRTTGLLNYIDNSKRRRPNQI